jgi:phospholipid/cholesterol/gamma-HCH transport system substrate-binding protein
VANSVAEAVIGAVVLAAAAGFVVYAGQTRGVGLNQGSLPLSARFRSAEGISVGTDVRIAGINVGSVSSLDLDPASFEAEVGFALRGDLKLPDDSDVKIASESLLGGNYVEITPGASETTLAAGDEIVNTQGSVSLLNLLMKFGTGK